MEGMARWADFTLTFGHRGTSGQVCGRNTAMIQDSAFAGSIPAIYEECLVPVLFAPYAEDLAALAG